ncbi:myotubularin-related protein 9-like isoform X2 [Asterias rubens]|uniref:myotubularin-related protein 9-like isoform X2 n=1 Tax=Asterias rubens TaxID=7604 RepID=UPI001455C728|nr:myotubularin-related protein 9-like isoform X2 [Asterias rubens]
MVGALTPKTQTESLYLALWCGDQMNGKVVRRPVEFHAMEFVEFIKTPKVDSVVLHRPFYPAIEGTLCLTGHHLILSSRKTNTEELWLLHSNIDAIEKKFSGSVGQLTIKCKNFMIIQLDINGMEECLNIASSIEMLSNLESVTLTYPFFYRPMADVLEDGWQAFLPETEFARMNTDDWRLSFVNKNFQVCPTYPQAVVVPKNIDDDCIMQAAAFRQGGRFPVLSYLHAANGTVILRSGQPLPGPNGKRCKEDESLLNSTLGIGKRGYIIDTRSYNSAVNSRSKGGGFETEAHYPQWRRVHKPLDRFSSLQESLTKLMEACNKNTNSMDKWLGHLGASSWLSNVKEVLTTACLVAQCVDRENSSVLVHGSEGLDATLQITSLAQIILNPDCRTVRGFEALVEREWVQSGHPFASRCAKSAYAGSKHKHTGPVFLLFLDCVGQILQQYQCSFEFNEKFLILLFENSYASQFGTFLCNNEHDRQALKLSTKTQSLWTYVNRPKILETYINPLYQPNSTVIWPSVAPQSLMLWCGLYLRWDMDKTVNDSTDAEIRKIQQNDKRLKIKAMQLRKQLAELQKEALEKGLIGE